MLRTDRPIKSIKDDILGRENFVKVFVRCIDGYVSSGKSSINDSLVIGLQGSWGCGKTSLINMISEELTSKNTVNQYLIKRLNTWTGINDEALLIEFFKTLLSATIYQDDFDKASALSIVKDILYKNSKYVSKGIALLSETVMGTSINEDVIEKNLFQKTFEEKKAKITKELAKSTNTIIYFIDDIDRLSDDEITLLFRLVKNIADFPNVIYVLCYDHEIVCKSINRLQKDDKGNYLEKIVQLPFDIPYPSRESLCEYCTQGIIITLQLDEEKKERYMLFVRELLLPYLKTLRDCNRFLNVLFFRYQVCGKDVNIPDLISITVLEVFDKKLYNIIYLNKDYFYQTRHNDTKDTELSQKLNEVGRKSRQLINLMFPKLIQTQDLSDYDLFRTIFSPSIHPINQIENFNLYFQMQISDRQTSWDDIQRTLTNSSEEEMLKRFKYWHQNNIWWDVADQIRKSLSMTRSDRLLFIDKIHGTRILEVLSRLEEWLDYKERIRMQTNLIFFLDLMLKKLLLVNKKDIDISFLCKLIKNQKISISLIMSIIPSLYKGKSIDPWHNNVWGITSDIDIDEKHLKKIETYLLTRIQNSISDKKIYSLGAANDILFYCGVIMPNIIKQYLPTTCNDEPTKERMALGLMLCISCFCGADRNLYWKKNPNRWKMIPDPTKAHVVFNEYWTADKLQKQSADIKLLVGVTKRLFAQEMVNIDEISGT